MNANNMEMASQSTFRTSQVASAINSLLHLEEGDQASLLNVTQDYFTYPSGSSSRDDSDSESDSEADIAGKGSKIQLKNNRPLKWLAESGQEEGVKGKSSRESLSTQKSSCMR